MSIKSIFAFVVIFSFRSWFLRARSIYKNQKPSNTNFDMDWTINRGSVVNNYTSIAQTSILIRNFPKNQLDEYSLKQKFELVYQNRYQKLP